MIAEIKQTLMHAMAWLPFLSAAVVSHTQLNISSFVSRVLETAIIGGIIMYTNVQILNVKLQDIQEDIHKIQLMDERNESLARQNREKMHTMSIEIKRLTTIHELRDSQSKN
jgi:hypothetical protein